MSSWKSTARRHFECCTTPRSNPGQPWGFEANPRRSSSTLMGAANSSGTGLLTSRKCSKRQPFSRRVVGNAGA